MSYYRRAKTTGASYFFTVVSYRRRDILCDTRVREALRKAIAEVRNKSPFTIDAWVLLPDHLHCIWTLPPNDADFSSRWGRIKRLVSMDCGNVYHRDEWMTTSKKKHRESMIWQRRFWEHQIRDEKDFNHHMDYIHYNPVKHGISRRVVDWPYSTFHRYVKNGIYPSNWGGNGIEFVDIGE